MSIGKVVPPVMMSATSLTVWPRPVPTFSGHGTSSSTEQVRHNTGHVVHVLVVTDARLGAEQRKWAPGDCAAEQMAHHPLAARGRLPRSMNIRDPQNPYGQTEIPRMHSEVTLSGQLQDSVGTDRPCATSSLVGIKSAMP